MQESDFEYVGFWARVWASLIDTVLMAIVVYPILIKIYGLAYFDVGRSGLIAGPMDFLISWVFPAVVVLLFWSAKQSTPGKMAIRAKIVDAETFTKPSKGQMIGRYLAYYVSTMPLCLGMLWVAFDKRKQGWHDKLAGTVVIRERTK